MNLRRNANQERHAMPGRAGVGNPDGQQNGPAPAVDGEAGGINLLAQLLANQQQQQVIFNNNSSYEKLNMRSKQSVLR